jgi:hypothetical protein
VPSQNIAIAARRFILIADRPSRRAAFRSTSLRRDCGPTRSAFSPPYGDARVDIIGIGLYSVIRDCQPPAAVGPRRRHQRVSVGGGLRINANRRSDCGMATDRSPILDTNPRVRYRPLRHDWNSANPIFHRFSAAAGSRSAARRAANTARRDDAARSCKFPVPEHELPVRAKKFPVPAGTGIMP